MSRTNHTHVELSVVYTYESMHASKTNETYESVVYYLCAMYVSICIYNTSAIYSFDLRTHTHSHFAAAAAAAITNDEVFPLPCMQDVYESRRSAKVNDNILFI